MCEDVTIDSESIELRSLLDETAALRESVTREGAALLREWGVDPRTLRPEDAAINLAHYVALRRHDLSALQLRLSAFGLSSLGRSEAKVAAALDALLATLRRLCGETNAHYPSRAEMQAGDDALAAACARIFGADATPRRTRVMATLPSDAATDPGLVARLIEAGMDCARINCAHDDADAWLKMIENIRAAERGRNLPCRIMMDIAGPKLRVEGVRAPEKYRLVPGERLQLLSGFDNGRKGDVAVTLNAPSVIDQLVVGDEVCIDDGKAGGHVVEKSDGRADVEILFARAKGVRLKPGKGVNLPTTELNLSPLTRKDFADLDIVARHADLVGFSFVQRPADIELLQDHLAARRGDAPPQTLVLKIETPLAVRNLPRLMLHSARQHPTAVMVARGDLAVELGFARLSEVQEEILWLCEAAHIPVIWATQVLDQFVKEGVASRPETTDAAMSQRADCVMLNKGPFLVGGVAFLRDVLARMSRHQVKKFSRYAELRAWSRN
ncbi:pyruvate kinase [Methylocystis sp. ATCC 49242]|uniref:pyruvate kinase n=1 Tax=Methylocystis sp. ATCC 49242 TaxID=622637 RepID=UPI0001F87A5E|nr:pyruvate kinase [Methylocystis sp. ATCC 49242]